MNKKAELLIDSDITDVWETDQFQPPEPEKTHAEKKVDAIAEALTEDADAFLSVQRQRSGGNSPMEFVGRFPADKFDFGQLQVHLQNTFGPGDYRCKLYAKGKIRANQLITIAEKIEPHQPSNTSEMGSFMNTVLGQMREMQNQILELSRENKTGSSSRMDWLQELGMMKQLFFNESQPKDGGGNMLDQFRGFLTLQNEMKDLLPAPSDGTDDEGFGSLIEKLTPMVTAAMSQGASAPPVDDIKDNPSPSPDEVRQSELKMQLKVGLAQLVQAAAKNGDHENYANMILDQVPEEVVRKVVLDTTTIKKLGGFHKEVPLYEPWFLMLGEHLKAMLGEPSAVSELYAHDLTPDSDGDTVQKTEPPPTDTIVPDEPTP